MDADKTPVWGLLEQGALPTTSKQMALETAVAMAYISLFLSQRETVDAIYRPFLNKYSRIRDERMDEVRSWFVRDPESLNDITGLYNEDPDTDISALQTLCGQEHCAPWTIDLLNWIGLGTTTTPTDGRERRAPFYGILPEGQIYPTRFNIITTPWAENYPQTRNPVIRTPFWKIVNHIREKVQPNFQEIAVIGTVLNNIQIQSDPLLRSTGDTLITSLWQDIGMTAQTSSDIWNERQDDNKAIPSVYRKDAAELIGMLWLNEVCKSNSDTGSFFGAICNLIRSAEQDIDNSVYYGNPNMSIESLGLPHFSMADATDDTDPSQETQSSQPPVKNAATQDEEDGTSQGTSDEPTNADTGSDDNATDPQATQPVDPSGDGSTDGQTDAPSDGQTDGTQDVSSDGDTDGQAQAQAPLKDNIDGLSFDTAGESRKDYLYRRGVLALATQVENDIDFPVTDEVRNLLQVYVDQYLFLVSIRDVKDYMKKLGLQNYLEAVSF